MFMSHLFIDWVGQVHSTEHVWRSEDSMLETGLSFYHVWPSG